MTDEGLSINLVAQIVVAVFVAIIALTPIVRWWLRRRQSEAARLRGDLADGVEGVSQLIAEKLLAALEDLHHDRHQRQELAIQQMRSTEEINAGLRALTQEITRFIRAVSNIMARDREQARREELDQVGEGAPGAAITGIPVDLPPLPPKFKPR